MSPASAESTLTLPFWYLLTQEVPEEGLLNVCVCNTWQLYHGNTENISYYHYQNLCTFKNSIAYETN